MEILTWLKNNILVVGLLLIVIWQSFESDKKISSLEKVIEQRDYIIEEKFNDLGQKVVTASTKTFKESQLNTLTKIDERFSELDKRLKANDRKLNQIQSSVGFDLSAKGEGVAQKLENNLPYFQWKYYDPILSIESQLNPENQLFHKWTIHPQTLYVDIFAKGRLFRSPLYTADISSNNPNIDISNTNIFTKKAPKPFLVLGVGAGLSVLPDFSIQPGLHISLVKPIYTFYK